MINSNLIHNNYIQQKQAMRKKNSVCITLLAYDKLWSWTIWQEGYCWVQLLRWAQVSYVSELHFLLLWNILKWNQDNLYILQSDRVNIRLSCCHIQAEKSILLWKWHHRKCQIIFEILGGIIFSCFKHETTDNGSAIFMHP